MVNTSHVDPWMKTDTWWLLWIIFVTEQLQLIYATFMYSLKKNKGEDCNVLVSYPYQQEVKIQNLNNSTFHSTTEFLTH